MAATHELSPIRAAMRAPTPQLNAALREILAEKGINNIRQFCVMLGLDPVKDYSTVSRWVKGPESEDSKRGVGPSLAVLPFIEDALNVGRGEILTRAKFNARRMSLVDEVSHSDEIADPLRTPVIAVVLSAVEETRKLRSTPLPFRTKRPSSKSDGSAHAVTTATAV